MPHAVALRPRSTWARLLASGRADEVLFEAIACLRHKGLRPAPRTVRLGSFETGQWLAVAGLCRLTPNDAARLLARTCPSDPLPAEIPFTDLPEETTT